MPVVRLDVLAERSTGKKVFAFVAGMSFSLTYPYINPIFGLEVNPNVFVFKFASTFLWLGVIKAIPCPSFLGRRQTLRGYRPTFSQETRLKPGFMTCVFGA